MTDTGPAAPGAPERSRLAWAAFLAACAVMIIGPTFFSRDLWHVDEIRYVEVAREMGEYSSLLLPELNGEVYAEKPPMVFALIAGIQRLVGDYELAGRILMLISVLGTALCVQRLGELLLGNRTHGALAGGVLLTFAFVIDRGQRVLLDPFVMFTGTLGALALVSIALGRRRRGHIGWSVVLAISMLAGCLTKGPAALISPLIAAGLCAALLPGRKRTLLALGFGALVTAGLTLGWLKLAADRAGPWYWDRMLFRQTLGRAHAAFTHREPWYYYLLKLPPRLLPWLLLVPVGATVCWRKRGTTRTSEPTGESDTGTARGRYGFILLWPLLGLLFFSAMSSKRTGYVLPFVPGVALIAAASLRALFEDQRVTRWGLDRLLQLGLWIVVAASIASGGFAGLVWSARVFPLGSTLQGATGTLSTLAILGLLVVAAALAVVGMAGHRRMSRGHREAATACLILGIALGCCGSGLAIDPLMNQRRAARPLIEAVTAAAPPEQIVLLGATLDGRVNYYSGVRHFRVAPSDALLDPALGRPLFVFGYTRAWNNDVPEADRAQFTEVLEGHVGRKRFSLRRWIGQGGPQHP
ncbi:MAG: ArnT family glycosyltransferase [Planctomycetota bacterium]